jgi:hypothetical protein
MAAICKVGPVELDVNLSCPALHDQQQIYTPTLMCGGGKEIVISTGAIPDLYLLALDTGSGVAGYVTYVQIKALRALPDGIPQLLLHPTATKLEMDGIMVIVDKGTLTPQYLTRVNDQGLGWGNEPQDNDKFSGSIRLLRIT